MAHIRVASQQTDGIYRLACLKQRDSSMDVRTGSFLLVEIRYGTLPEFFVGGQGMGLLELFLLAVGLSMDAFAVSICKGLSAQKLEWKHYLIIGAWFGGFQALMPTIGYLLGSFFESYINAFDHWVAFVLLALIGANMLKEAFSKKEAEETDASFGFRSMLVLAVATSIDALAVGITFALLPDVNIVAAVSFIGVITFILSAIGLKVGNLFGLRYKQKAEIAGGIILILIGLKILLEHLGVINF